MQRLVALEQHVVGDVDDVADRPHARRARAAAPSTPATGPSSRLRPGRGSGGSGRARRRPRSLSDVGPPASAGSSGSGPASGSPKCAASSRATPTIAHRVGPVRGDRQVEDDVVEPEHLAHVGAELGRPSRWRIPAWSSPRPSSSAEHSIPSDSTPRILRRSSLNAPGICAPAGAYGTTIARGDVLRAAHDPGRAAAEVDVDEASACRRSGCFTTSSTLRRDDAADVAAGLLDALDLQPELVERLDDRRPRRPRRA